MEMLKTDLRAIQGGLRELLGVSGSPLSVPSWKFPSKRAAEVDVDEALKNHAATLEEGKNVEQHQVYILELIVDRYPKVTSLYNLLKWYIQT